MYVGAVARERPDALAYVVAGPGGQVRESVIYRQLDERSNRLAHLLRDRGLRPGDAVAICMDNHPRFLEVAWAAQRSGLRYAAANWRLTPNELAHVVNDSGARALVVSPATAGLATALLGRTPGVHTRLAVGADVAGRHWSRRSPVPMPYLMRWVLLVPRGPQSPARVQRLLQPRSGERILEIG
ncbi:MAG TPA: AMP-binding protein, partial [Frankiaceae bacterium]|nr:AMP-binding protein [Frankiaceae bacterium]